jgi:hypothetical protein
LGNAYIKGILHYFYFASKESLLFLCACKLLVTVKFCLFMQN